MTYNFIREDVALRHAMAHTYEGRLTEVEEDTWSNAVKSFIHHYSEDVIPCPDTMVDPPRVLPVEEIESNLREMCKKAERTHRFRRFLLENRDPKKWAVWLDIGCRSAFPYPEHPKMYTAVVEQKEGRGW